MNFKCEHPALDGEGEPLDDVTASWKVDESFEDPRWPGAVVIPARLAACPDCGQPGVAQSKKKMVVLANDRLVAEGDGSSHLVAA